jgi:hypothetical protein
MSMFFSRPRAATTLWPAVLTALAVLFLDPQPARSHCAVKVPEDVLNCLARAYSQKDLEAYDDLYAADFVYQFGADGPSWGLQEERRTAEKLFHSPDVRKISLVFPPGYTVAEGTEPGTWILDQVSEILTVDAVEGGKSRQYKVENKKNSRFTVRLVPDPEPHYRISRWDYTPEEKE